MLTRLLWCAKNPVFRRLQSLGIFTDAILASSRSHVAHSDVIHVKQLIENSPFAATPKYFSLFLK